MVKLEPRQHASTAALRLSKDQNYVKVQARLSSERRKQHRDIDHWPDHYLQVPYSRLLEMPGCGRHLVCGDFSKALSKSEPQDSQAQHHSGKKTQSHVLESWGPRM